MSFKVGSKDKRIEELEAEVAQLKRTLGGSQAANNRLKGENRTLSARVDKLETANGKLCAEVNGKTRHVEELEKLALGLMKGHECGAGCMWYGGCRHPIADECPMEERMRALGLEV